MTGDFDRIRTALQHIPANDREVWLRMGMAVKSEFGEPGFDLWQEWSQQDESFDARAARDVWKSIGSAGKVTAGTLFHEAKAHGWRDDGTIQKPSAETLATRRREALQRAEVEQAKTACDHANTAMKAAAIWKLATAVLPDHPYLSGKAVLPVATLREIAADAVVSILGYAPKAGGEPLTGRLLVVPIKVDDALSTLELIDGTGRKSALAGGKKAGGYWAAQALPQGRGDGLTFQYGEGVATTLSAKEANGNISIAALSASNLLAMAQAMQQRYPAARHVILADLVKATGEPDPHAIAAAHAIGGVVAIPEFGSDRPQGATDFNDMHKLCGLDAVRRAIAQATLTTGQRAQPAHSAATWQEPQAIQAPLRSVPVFDPDILLPESLRGWIMDEADRMPCPPDFVAAGVMVALGAIIGARCAIKPKSRDSWMIVPNLWGGIVGLPSAKKSPAIGAALKPLDRLITQAMDAYQAEMEAFEGDKTIFEAKKEAIESRIKSAAKDAKKGDLGSIAKELQEHRQQAQQAPVLRRYKSNDTTVEKLGELLRDNPAGLMVMRDELVGLIASWDREGREGERAFYLEAWNGNASFDTDRIGRGSIFIPNLCVSIFGGIQPDKLTGYLEQASHTLSNDGMLQRFQLLVYPDHRPWEWRDRIPAKDARDRAFKVFDGLVDFDPVEWGATPADEFVKFSHFNFDAAAQEIFIEWSGDLHRVRMPAEDNPIIAQHLSKFDKLFPALALILHLVDCMATGRRGAVTAEAAMRAAAWCEYLEAHARRCYGLLTDDGLRAAQALADKLRQGKLSDGFTARDVRRNQWRNLTTDDAVQAALDWLEDEYWLQSEEAGGTGPGTGRRTKRYIINPLAAKSAKAGKTESGL